MVQKERRLLLIGGVSYKNTAHPRLGGTTVLMDNLVEYCEEHCVPHIVIPSHPHLGKFAVLRNIVSVISRLVKGAKRGDVVMVNISSKAGIITLYPLICIFSHIIGLQVVCRKFAGSIHKYLDASAWKKKIAVHILRQAKCVFFETEELIDWAHKNGIDATWFPNVRKPSKCAVSEIYDRKIVFISQIYEDKGVDILLNVASRLPKEYIVDFYGPVIGTKYTSEYFTAHRATYKGVLKPEEVTNVMSNYNVLALPTFWHSEGYPGVIIEAMSVNLPVVSTHIGGIPELIKDGVNGILVDPKDESALEAAILSIDQERYCSLVSGSHERFETYNSDVVNERIINQMLS